jgi:Bacterial sugar transferase
MEEGKSQRPMIILGLNAYHADAATAIVVDGKLVAADEEERFRQIKHAEGTDDVPNFDLRHRVRPGLTGLAQIYAPRDASRKDKLRYDLLYARSRTFWLDMKLIALSFWITFRGRWEAKGKKV